MPVAEKVTSQALSAAAKAHLRSQWSSVLSPTAENTDNLAENTDNLKNRNE